MQARYGPAPVQGISGGLQQRASLEKEQDMVNIIVTGHGGFAAGMEKNVKMLAGADTQLTAIDFMEGMTPEELSEKLKTQIEKETSGGFVLILADLVGGTPYNCAATLSVQYPNVRVIGGANSALLMEACMCNVTGEEIADADKLAEDLIENARAGMEKFVLDIPAAEDETDSEDGI